VVGLRLSGMRGLRRRPFARRRPRPARVPASPSVGTVTAYSSDSAVPRVHIGAYPKRRPVRAPRPDESVNAPPAVPEARYADFFSEGASAPGAARPGGDELQLG
jgi:hypothetical protein